MRAILGLRSVQLARRISRVQLYLVVGVICCTHFCTAFVQNRQSPLSLPSCKYWRWLDLFILPHQNSEVQFKDDVSSEIMEGQGMPRWKVSFYDPTNRLRCDGCDETVHIRDEC